MEFPGVCRHAATGEAASCFPAPAVQPDAQRPHNRCQCPGDQVDFAIGGGGLYTGEPVLDVRADVGRLDLGERSMNVANIDSIMVKSHVRVSVLSARTFPRLRADLSPKPEEAYPATL